MELHPSKTSRDGHLDAEVISKGPNKDIGAYPATKDVYCRQCGFVCNLAKDMRGSDQFASETISQGIKITDHGYPSRSEIDAGDTYEGSERSTTSLSAELTNGSFEDWTAGSPDSWTISGSVTQTTTAGYFDPSDDGVSSAKIERSGSDISLSQAMATPSDFNANTVVFRVRVKSSTNEVIRLRMDINGVTYYSHYNVAQQRFQELPLMVICPAVVSSLTVYILADNSDGTAYIDQAILARSGNQTTASVTAGCPHCGSSNYF